MFLRDQEPVLRKELGKGVEMSGCFYPPPTFISVSPHCYLFLFHASYCLPLTLG